MSRKSIRIIAGAIAVAGFAGYAAAQDASEINIVLSEQPANLEPCGTIITNVGQILSRNVVEPLTVIDPASGQATPGLATEWTQTNPNTWQEKVEAAYQAGCRRFDGAMKGFGGCPMAKDELVGNMATENLVHYFRNIGVDLNLDEAAFAEALAEAGSVFVH